MTELILTFNEVWGLQTQILKETVFYLIIWLVFMLSPKIRLLNQKVAREDPFLVFSFLVF